MSSQRGEADPTKTKKKKKSRHQTNKMVRKKKKMVGREKRFPQKKKREACVVWHSLALSLSDAQPGLEALLVAEGLAFHGGEFAVHKGLPAVGAHKAMLVP